MGAPIEPIPWPKPSRQNSIPTRVHLGQRHPGSRHVAEVPGVRVQGRPKDKFMPPCETDGGACSNVP